MSRRRTYWEELSEVLNMKYLCTYSRGGSSIVNIDNWEAGHKLLVLPGNYTGDNSINNLIYVSGTILKGNVYIYDNMRTYLIDVGESVEIVHYESFRRYNIIINNSEGTIKYNGYDSTYDYALNSLVRYWGIFQID